MKHLAIDTEMGRKAESDGRTAATMAAEAMGAQFVFTNPDSIAVADGMIVKNGALVAIVEVKTRYDMDLDKLFSERNGKWLVTAQKIDSILDIAKKMCIHTYGFLYLPQSSLVLAVKIADNHGNFSLVLEKDYRQTRKTVNGGVVRRENYLIPMHTARKVEVA